jgi:hypothetical protein
VAVPEQTEATIAPIVVPPPLTEKTVLGVGMKGLSQPEQPSPPEPPQPSAKVAAYLKEYEPKRVPPPATDPSVPIDLSVLKVHSEPSLVPAGVPRRRATLWWVLLLFLTAAVAVGNVRRDPVRALLIARWHQVTQWVRSH